MRLLKVAVSASIIALVPVVATVTAAPDRGAGGLTLFNEIYE
jgi:hypothetical protein